MKEVLLLNLAKRLAVPLLAALGGYLAAHYPEEVNALCQGVGF